MIIILLDILQVKCGKKEEKKLHFLYKDWLEDGLQEEELMHWDKKNYNYKMNN